jgi:hypothetical protein
MPGAETRTGIRAGGRGGHGDGVRGDPAPPQLAQEVPAVPVGQIEVEDEDVRAGVGEGADRGFARFGFADEEAALDQVRPQGPAQAGVVLDEEHLSIHGSSPLPAVCVGGPTVRAARKGETRNAGRAGGIPLPITPPDYTAGAQRGVNVWAPAINVQSKNSMTGTAEHPCGSQPGRTLEYERGK